VSLAEGGTALQDCVA